MPTTTERMMCCPHCGIELDAHTGQTGSRPRPGDLGICWKCAGLQVYTTSGMRLPTDRESENAVRDPRVRRVVEAVRRKVAGPSRVASDVLDSD